MKNKCNIVSDLLPLYCENMVSDDSKKFIEDHVKECEKCQQELDDLMAEDSLKSMEQAAMQEPTDQMAKGFKKVQNKMRRNIMLSYLIIVLIIGLAYGGFWYNSLGKISDNLEIRPYENSEIYTSDDINSAMAQTKKEFKKYKGCTLETITYAGDDAALDLKKGGERKVLFKNYDEFIVIETDFKVDQTKENAFDGVGYFYQWQWIFGRYENGNWKLVNEGYF